MLALEEKEKELEELSDEFDRSKQLYTDNNAIRTRTLTNSRN